MGILDFLKKPAERLLPRSPLNEANFCQMIFTVESSEIPADLPELQGKKALEFSPSLPSLSRFLKERNARLLARIAGKLENETGKNEDGAASLVLFRGEILPFLDASWDFILLRAPRFQGDLNLLLRETARVLRPGGMLVLGHVHPKSLLARRNLSKGDRAGLEGYFNLFRELHMNVQMVRETFFEGSLRKFFLTEEEKESFERLKKTPFLVFFLLRKEG